MAQSLSFTILARDLASGTVERVGRTVVGLGGQVARAGSQFLTLGGSATLGAAGIVQAGAALAGFASQLGGITLALPAVLGAGGLAAGTLATGLDGVSEALEAYTAVQDGAAAAAADGGAAMESAAEDVAAATDQVADAQRASTRAARDERAAHEALAGAYTDANRALEDLANQVADYSLDAEGAAIRVARAEERRDEILANAESTILDRREAENELAQARNRQADLARRAARDEQDLTAAQAAGVDGSDQVVAAQDRLTDAQDRVSDTGRQLQDAQADLREALDEVAVAARGGSDAAADYDAALADLAPSAREFVGQLNAVRDGFGDVRLDVQQELFRGLGAEVEALGRNYLPILRSELTSTAAAFNEAGRDTSSVLTDPSGVQDVGFALGNMRVFLDEASDAAAPLVSALLDITAVGSTFLPAWGAALGEGAERFADFISEARASGELAGWIQGGVDALMTLVDVAGTVGSILGGIFDAAGAAQGNPFGAVLDGIDEFVNSAEGQQTLIALFEAVNSVVAALLPVLGALAEVLGTTVAPAFAQLVVAAAPGFLAFVESLGAVFTILMESGALELVGQALGALAGALGEVLVAAAPGIAQVLTAISLVLIELAESGVLTTVGLLLVDLAVALLPLLDYVAPLVELLVEMAVALAPLVPFLVDLAVVLLEALLPPLLEITRALAPFVAELAKLAGEVLVELVESGLFQELVSVSLAFLEALLPLLPVLFELARVLLPILADVLGFIVPIAGELGRQMAEVLGWAIRDIVIPLLDGLIGLLRDLGPMISDGLRSLGDIPAMMRRAFDGAVNWLGTAGRDIVVGLWNGLVGWWDNEFLPRVRSLTDGFVSWFKGIFGIRSPSTVFAGFGVEMIRGLSGGLERQTPALIRSAQAITDELAAQFDQPITTGGVVDAAKELADFVRSGAPIFEDLSVRGGSANLGAFNDELADAFYGAGGGDNGELLRFLNNFASRGGDEGAVAGRAGGMGGTGSRAEMQAMADMVGMAVHSAITGARLHVDRDGFARFVSDGQTANSGRR